MRLRTATCLKSHDFSYNDEDRPVTSRPRPEPETALPNSPSDPFQLALVREEGLAIAPFPLDWTRCYDDPPTFPDDDPDWIQMVRDFIDREDAVLYWGNELFLDSSGDVIAT